MDFKFDESEVLKAISTMHKAGSLFEIRLIASGKWNASGYFTDAGTAINALKAIASKINSNEYGYRPPETPHIYITLNSPKQAAYSRTQRDTLKVNVETTKDAEITSLQWLLIDADAKREASGISSSKEEKEAAKATAKEVKAYLDSKHWPAPIIADSGNGYHLLYKIDLPTEAAHTVTEPLLKAIAGTFDNDKCDIDKKVFNAARICKLYGSYAVKGADSPERPHRLSKLLEIPDNIQVVSAEQMQEVIEELTTAKQTKQEESEPVRISDTAGRFNLDNFLAMHNISYKQQQGYSSVIYSLDRCPWQDEHSSQSNPGDSKIFLNNNGSIGFECHHNTCSGRKWQDLRELYEPGYKAEQEQRQREYELRNSKIDNLYKQHKEQTQANVAELSLQDQSEYEQQNQASSYIDTMRQEIEAEASIPLLSTGFKNVDRIIGGGLNTGLCCIGAISSLGKTTFALQVADNIAKQGRDILIISLEMAKRELIAKSISRLTAEYSKQTKGTCRSLGRTTLDIMNLRRQRGFTDEAGNYIAFDIHKQAEIEAVIDKAYSIYKDYSNHIFIYEGVGDITPEKIKEYVENHKRIYGQAPVLFIDYLQIIQGNDRDSDKTKTDKNVVALKRISRDYKIPVIAISSVNRSSYNEPISTDSFKESGGIEFSSDILIGLQYEGLDYETIEKGESVSREKEQDRLARLSKLYSIMQEKAKQGEPQPIQLKVLKNRNGSRGTAGLSFVPMFNLFTERDLPQPKAIKKF